MYHKILLDFKFTKVLRYLDLIDKVTSFVLCLLIIITILGQTELNISNNNLTEGSTEGRDNANKTNSTLPGFNFAAAGDWACNEMT